MSLCAPAWFMYYRSQPRVTLLICTLGSVHKQVIILEGVCCKLIGALPRGKTTKVIQYYYWMNPIWIDTVCLKCHFSSMPHLPPLTFVHPWFCWQQAGGWGGQLNLWFEAPVCETLNPLWTMFLFTLARITVSLLYPTSAPLPSYLPLPSPLLPFPTLSPPTLPYPLLPSLTLSPSSFPYLQYIILPISVLFVCSFSLQSCCSGLFCSASCPISLSSRSVRLSLSLSLSIFSIVLVFYFSLSLWTFLAWVP